MIIKVKPRIANGGGKIPDATAMFLRGLITFTETVPHYYFLVTAKPLSPPRGRQVWETPKLIATVSESHRIV